MRLVLLGAPGSGKGTQAQKLSKNFNLRHLATGDILREAVSLETLAGKRAKPFLAAGRLVPDELINDLVAEILHHNPRPEKFILDGYPRTLGQAQAFDRLLSELKLDLTAAVFLNVDDHEIVRRLSGRWSCPNCKAPYHVDFKPPKKPGVCDECGAELVQREDDKESTVRRRLKVYHETLADVLDHYQKKGILREVPGTGDVEKIYAKIVAAL